MILPILNILISLFIFYKITIIMSTQAELAAQLKTITGQVQKIGAEISKTLEKVIVLEEAINTSGSISPELQTAFDELKAQVELTDGLIADVPTEPIP